MPAMDQLKLIALDEDDLKVVSAHVQDAVLKVSDLQYLPAAKQFALAMNRFVWEKEARFLNPNAERRNAVLHFGRVLSAKVTGIDRGKPDEVLSLLAVGYTAGEAPAGTIDLVFAGGAAVRLGVECVEARLADLGGAWEASSRPSHKV